MVQIKEYTARQEYRPKLRSGTSIDIPSNYFDGNNIVSNLKKPAKALRDISKEYGIAEERVRKEEESRMRAEAARKKEEAAALKKRKEDRDKAFVAEQTALYIRNANTFMQDYKSKNKGKDAERAAASFEEWSNQYVSNIKFENKDQQDAFNLKRLSSDTNFFNDAVKYSYDQGEEYYKNANNSLISTLSTQLTTEQDPQNILNDMLSIKQAVANVNPGQDDSLINSEYKKVVSDSLSANVLNSAINDPADAILRMKSPLFSENISEDTYFETKGKVIAAFEKKAVDMLARDKMSFATFVSSLEDPFFSDIQKEDFSKRVFNEAIKKRAVIEQTEVEAGIKRQNDVVSKYLSTTDPEDLDSLKVELMQTPGADNTLFVINRAEEGIKLMDFAESNGITMPEPNEVQNNLYSSIKERIESGYYKTIGDMKNDILKLNQFQAQELVGHFVNNYEFNKELDSLKKSGNDVDRMMDSAISNWGFNKKDNPYLSDSIKKDASRRLVEMKGSGIVIDEKAVRQAVYDSIEYMNSDSNDDSVVRKTYASIADDVEENPEKRKELAASKIEDNFSDIDFTKEQLDTISQYFLVGDTNRATNYVRSLRQVKSRNILAKQKSIETIESITGRPHSESIEAKAMAAVSAIPTAAVEADRAFSDLFASSVDWARGAIDEYITSPIQKYIVNPISSWFD